MTTFIFCYFIYYYLNPHINLHKNFVIIIYFIVFEVNSLNFSFFYFIFVKENNHPNLHTFIKIILVFSFTIINFITSNFIIMEIIVHLFHHRFDLQITFNFKFIIFCFE